LHLFWADERCVPPHHADSNYAIAERELIAPLGLAAGQVHRIPGEMIPTQAAHAASGTLLEVVGKSGAWPVIDFVFLGMGEDGHTASLFPGATPDAVKDELYVAVKSPKPPPHRVTMNYGLLSAAVTVTVLISGVEKSGALRASLVSQATPLGRLLAMRSRTVIFTDIQGISLR
jgi:6-phosphogluconolactonase